MIKKLFIGLLVIGGIMTAPTTALAEDAVDKGNYQQNDAFSYIVSATSGKVITVNDDQSLQESVTETTGNNLQAKALFNVTSYPEVNRVQISLSGTPTNVWVSNGETLNASGTRQATIQSGSWEGFEIEVVNPDSGLSKIKNFAGDYLVRGGDGKLAIGDSSKAELFYIISPKYDDTSVYIQHVASGKFIKADGINGNPLTVDGEKVADKVNDDLRFSTLFGDFNGVNVMNFVSKKFTTLAWKSGGAETVFQNSDIKAGGWESIIVEGNGDGTISFKDSQNNSYITVKDNHLVRGYATPLTDNEKFVIHTVTKPKAVENVVAKEVKDTSVTISWTGIKDSIYTGYQVTAVNPATLAPITSKETKENEQTITGLTAGTTYEITVQTKNGVSPYSESEKLTIQTKNGDVPVQSEGLTAKEVGSTIELNWKAVANSTGYNIYRAKSAYDKEGYQKIAENVTATTFVDSQLNESKYNNYYKVTAINENGEAPLSDEYTSLETVLFGKNMYIFSPYDDTKKIDELMVAIFTKQNDQANDAQFNENRFGIYFKPGDYTKTKTMPIGFYTQVAGLGRTPYEVKLNNMEVPAYTDNNNATLNFWRSAENLSVMATGDDTSYFGGWRPAQFNWGVAQAAPLRRIYSQRAVSYDWNYGWASGGYMADSLVEGKDTAGNSAGTFSGQQFYTRNSKVIGNVFGTTLNGFYQGVEAPNLPTGNNGDALVKGNGFSNWGIPTADNNQQVVTNVSTTPIIREKPFLYLDNDGEYKVFVPALTKNTKGISWSKENMGNGTSHSLSEFYIAKEGDSAGKINQQLAAGKHLFFTPGIYHAEEVIQVTKADTIVLGTGMASIIPDNTETAMKVADVDKVTIAGLIFDAGAHSKSLLEVGAKGDSKDHAKNPTLLSDLFFRVGGTTASLTKSDDALIINSNDVIGDHFWIWRADHGAGVAWDGNVSYHGLIVNGNNVTSYALFNEHFQEYNTLWNGENGATYFYQNETPYDPISQAAWMSHDNTVKGYSAYKVANQVNKHYAVGLGIYNVFIYTGPTYDASKVQIQQENAIEVPNKPGVLIENATTQTFAKSDGALQKINHIINGTGESVSSGIDQVTGEVGTGWDRKYILNYLDGVTTRGFHGSIIEQGQQPTDE
ncbi:fibronectin type III domain-containing protein [Carnobacterium gallinarum]|uniref:fibronectin type III domain-containing protein n=1 Tax=Carnobacterium gallinarum TaxID=2749 RepID=UPI000B08A37A|nr:fibronectin type III domain-containing protein [Carnobacterium gallinarum]